MSVSFSRNHASSSSSVRMNSPSSKSSSSESAWGSSSPASIVPATSKWFSLAGLKRRESESASKSTIIKY